MAENSTLCAQLSDVLINSLGAAITPWPVVVRRGGHVESVSDILFHAAVCTSHISKQMANVQPTNHTPVLISAPNVFLMVVVMYDLWLWELAWHVRWTCLSFHPCVVCCMFSLFISTRFENAIVISYV
jgi:hypothetical protein